MAKSKQMCHWNIASSMMALAAAHLSLSGKEVYFVDQLNALGRYSLTDGAVTEVRVDDLVRQQREVWKAELDRSPLRPRSKPSPQQKATPRILGIKSKARSRRVKKLRRPLNAGDSSTSEI